MMWLNICQGLMLLGWVARLLVSVIHSVNGRKVIEPTGALGVFISLVWHLFSALVIWKSGALSTILGGL